MKLSYVSYRIFFSVYSIPSTFICFEHLNYLFTPNFLGRFLRYSFILTIHTSIQFPLRNEWNCRGCHVKFSHASWQTIILFLCPHFSLENSSIGIWATFTIYFSDLDFCRCFCVPLPWEPINKYDLSITPAFEFQDSVPYISVVESKQLKSIELCCLFAKYDIEDISVNYSEINFNEAIHDYI